MVRKAIIIRANKKSKYPVRNYSICLFCGRRRGKFRIFNRNRVNQNPICRLDFFKRVNRGEITGYRKASW